MLENKFARQILFLGKEGQAKIEAKKVAIVGLGGLGSHLCQELAYLGVNQFVLIDDDKVSSTNLNRLIGATPQDAVEGTPKTIVCERMICSINPESKVQAVFKNLRSEDSLKSLIASDVVFGGVDHDGPRLILMELCAAYNKPYFDLATEIFSEDGRLIEFGGRLVVSLPNEYCLRCSEQIDLEMAKQDLETKDTYELRRKHGYGLGVQIEAPSVIMLNGVIANLAMTEFMFYITGIRKPFLHLTYHGLRGRVNERSAVKKNGCYTCDYLVAKREAANILRYVLK